MNLPYDLRVVISIFLDPASLSRVECTSTSAHADHLLAWRSWRRRYQLASPTKKSRIYRTDKQVFLKKNRFAHRLCIGSLEQPGCWSMTHGEVCCVAQAFGGPRMCRSCENKYFVSISRARVEFSEERANALYSVSHGHRRAIHAAMVQEHNKLIRNGEWVVINHKRLYRGTFARRDQIDRPHMFQSKATLRIFSKFDHLN